MALRNCGSATSTPCTQPSPPTPRGRLRRMHAPSSGQPRPGRSRSMPSSERGTTQSQTGRSRTMIIRTGILTRRPDLTPEQFRTHWLKGHGPLAAKLPGLRRYHQNHVVDASQLAIDHARGTWEVDGFSQLWFDDVDAMRRAVESPEFRPTVPDIAKFCGDIRLVVCQPNIVVPGAAGTAPLVKRMSILTRRLDITAERFRDEWFGFHAEAVRKFPNLM